MVLCLDDAIPVAADIQRELAARWPDLPPATDLETGDATLSMRLGADEIILGQMPGPVIKDGDTVGEDANERIRVVYSKSAFGHDRQVMRLQYDTASPKKPWWKLW